MLQFSNLAKEAAVANQSGATFNSAKPMEADTISISGHVHCFGRIKINHIHYQEPHQNKTWN